MVEALEHELCIDWTNNEEFNASAEKMHDAIQAGNQAIAELENQEPRNVRERWNVELDGNDLLVCFNDHEKGNKCQYERYSPQRTWVGLTDEEISLLLNQSDLLDMFENIGWYSAPKNGFKKNSATLIRAIEAKLKQKNGYAEEKNT
jgi:hypothetical protein